MSRYDAIPGALVTADLGEGVGVQPVIDWSITRKMSGGGLPGQARGASGASVGSGSVTVDSPAGCSPWTPGPIRPGGRVALDARADAGSPLATVGDMVIRDVSGTATSRTLALTIEDDLAALRDRVRVPSVLPAAGVTVDASTLITQIAQAAGVPSVDVGASGSPLSAVLLDAGRSGWVTLQEIARATFGWVGIGPDGTLIYRGRAALTDGAISETIVAEDSLEDVSWTISTDDVADRVEVTFSPPVVRRSGFHDLDVWASTDNIFIAPGASQTLYADIDGAADLLAAWQPAGWTGDPPERWSRWTAYDETTALIAPDSALRIVSTLVTPSRLSVTLSNVSPVPLVVTELVQRADVRATRGEARTLARGAPEGSARSTLSVDLGAWVQDEGVAHQYLAWLAGTVSEPLPTLTGVRVIPDVSRRLGQIVKVTDRTTALTAKALITGISMSGSDGSLTQTLTLIVLWVTAGDLARYHVATLGPAATAGDVAAAITTRLGPSATAADYAAWIPTGVI